MPENVDEDLIEATIRRVAEANAARQDAPQPDSPREVEPEPQPARAPAAEDGVDEDLIAATIRRVQAQKAAADAGPAPEADEGDEAGWTGADAAEPEDVGGDEAGAPDEDAIAATILRVQQQQAARESTFAPGEPLAVDTAPASEAHPEGALASIEQQLRAAHDALARLTGRVEALERAALRSASAQVTPLPSRHEAEDAAPVVASGFGAPQRPSIVRDMNVARTALAEQLPDPGVIDTRPLPKPLPPIHAESKRGLDLLPRTYRITVEDKRRGVDLVPLHRALLSMDGVKDMSLLSYNNGVAIVALETTNDLIPDDLGHVVSRAMSRGAKVEQHNEHTFVVKLAED
ncbi:MAG TPA: hypothetical protein VFH62_00510 [Dehalococcoidia bacterium]|nr:hypothetical protein [Dehalococcoidia bacterium]